MINIMSTESSDEMDAEAYTDVGDVLDGRYVLIKKLGGGVFSHVWLSYDMKDDDYYAVKVHGDEDDNDYAEVEIKTLERVRRHNIPYSNTHVRDFVWIDDYDEEHVCIVYKILAGTLEDIIRIDKYKNGLPVEVVSRVMRQVMTALAGIHGQLKMIHTDIKIENVLYKGVNDVVEDVIDKFNQLKFNKLVQAAKKKSRYRGLSKEQIAARVAKNVLNKDDDSDYNDELDIPEGVREKDIMSIECVLSDFGTAIPVDRQGKDIQCRYYRSPEVILGCLYNEKCDIWSMGCLCYELLTGKDLFDPDKTREMSRDKHHLYDMYCTLGPIPPDMIKEARNRSVFFRSNGLLKCREKIVHKTIRVLLHDNRPDIDVNTLDMVNHFICSCLTYSPQKRPGATECLKHPFLSSGH